MVVAPNGGVQEDFRQGPDDTIRDQTARALKTRDRFRRGTIVALRGDAMELARPREKLLEALEHEPASARAAVHARDACASAYRLLFDGDDLTAACAIGFLRRAVDWFAERGVQIRAVMSDNGSCYVAHSYAAALAQLGLKHIRIKPYRPRTNGKAERLIQTLLNEWAYARLYGSSQERAAALTLYLDRYNYRRRHGSLSHQPPASRLNNLIGNYN